MTILVLVKLIMWRISTTTTTTTTVTTAVTIAPASNNNYFNSRENIFVETVNLPFDTQTDKSLTTSRTYTIIACSQVCKRPISFENIDLIVVANEKDFLFMLMLNIYQVNLQYCVEHLHLHLHTDICLNTNTKNKDFYLRECLLDIHLSSIRPSTKHGLPIIRL